MTHTVVCTIHVCVCVLYLLGLNDIFKPPLAILRDGGLNHIKTPKSGDNKIYIYMYIHILTPKKIEK